MPPDTALSRVQKSKSLDEQAYGLIKEAIIRCSLGPGEFVAEVRLADEMGISKTPIRKAMARLHQEGFLDNIPYRGYSVAEISVQDVDEVYKLREILECHVVRETTSLFTSDELDQIESIIDRADRAFANGAMAEYVENNREFHRAFSRKHGNKRIEDTLRNLEEHVRRIVMFVRQNGHNDLLDQQREDHRLILMAMREGDVDRAASMMSTHLLNFSHVLVARLKIRADSDTTHQATASIPN